MRLRLLRRSAFRRILREEKGQSIALAALLLLFTFTAVMVTFAIGHRVREKIKLQSLADSSAYSIAVVEARTFNYFAWSNRARISREVAVLSVMSHISYITFMEDQMNATGNALYEAAAELVILEAACPFTGLCCQGIYDAKLAKDAGDYYKSSDWPALKWYKDQRDTWDPVLGGVALAHYELVRVLQGKQIAMGVKLAAKIGVSEQAMAKEMAQKVDPKIKAPLGANVRNGQLALDVVHFPAPTVDNNAYDDYDEILSATRYPDWVTDKSFLQFAGHWDGAAVIANTKTAPQCWFTPVGSDWGNSKTVSSAPSTFSKLQKAIHKDQKDKESGWAGLAGYGSEDHGGSFINIFCLDPCDAIGYWTADGGVYGDSDDRGRHFWRKPKNKSETDMGKHSFEFSDKDGSIYINHPRYKWRTGDSSEEDIWRHPHTVAYLTKEMGKEKNLFDMKFSLALPVPVDFKTIGGVGDSDASGVMGAVAGGLTYYHKPKKRQGASGSVNGNDHWKEPPSFWNPFWRAKLHPLRVSDYDAAVNIHQPTATAIVTGGALVGGDLLNY